MEPPIPFLLDYVRSTAERIISEREQKGDYPPRCMLTDIMQNLEKIVADSFTELSDNGIFKYSTTINKTPMLLRK
ncbi:MAG: hypothetical protein K2K97_02645 [Muribaculaceae bacterium]|nr:hypothetical protein [Muribaculaceae bacterium]